jgi:antitoxin FitA
MPSMTIKSIPDRVYRSLKRSARAHHRSLNGETIARLEESLGLTGPSSTTVLTRIDAIRQRLRGVKLTERVLRAAKTGGRP